MLMELLTGHRPVNSVKDDPIEIVTMQLKAVPPALAQLRPGTAFGELEAVVAKALAKSADDRYQTAGEFAEALEGAHRRRSSSLAMPAPAPVDGTSAISPSMVLPAAGTRLGLPVHPTGPGDATVPAPPGPPAPLEAAPSPSPPVSQPRRRARPRSPRRRRS